VRRTDAGDRNADAARPAVIAGRYEPAELLSESPHATVYRALDRATGRAVAVRMTLRPVARALENLTHPHIATIIDAGVLRDGRAFTVTAFVQGPTLRRVLDGGLQDPAEALRWMTEILDALCAVHRFGIVHCDVKPENIVLSATGGIRRAVLLDFGFAREADTPIDEIAATPRYAAPEQLRGERVGTNADLYAWALTLLESLGAPTPGDDDVHRVVARRTDSAPVEIPAALRWTPLGQLLRDMLEKDPAKRPQDTAAALDRLLAAVPMAGALGNVHAASRVSEVSVVAAQQLTGECRDPSRQRDDFVAAASELRAAGATLVSAAGSSIVAAFGLRGEDETRGRAAVDAGRALLRRFENAGPGTSAWSIGIDRGPASSYGLAAFDAVELLGGDAFDVAVRIADGTRPGRLALSGRAFESCADEHEAVLVGSVRSGTDAVAVYQWKPEWTAHAAVTRRIAGRDVEIAELRAMWEKAENGAASAVLLHGPAGIGKSMLVQELVARARGASVLSASCAAARVAQPFAAVRELLGCFDGSPTALLRRYGLETSDAPLLALLRSDLRAEEPAGSGTPEHRRSSIEDLVIELLVRAATEFPVLVVLEDLHWADPSTAQLVAMLLARLREPRHEPARILVVATSRDAQSLASSAVRRIDVGPVTASAAAELLALHLDAGAAAGRRAIAAAAKHCGGLPLFLDQAGRLLATDPAIRIPSTLDEVLAVQVARLRPASFRVALAAAALGDDADTSMLAEVCAMPRSEVESSLEELVAAGLLFRGAAAAVRYVHALVQDAVLAAAAAGERRALHRRIARILENEKAGIGFERPAELAFHLEAGGDASRAAELWHRAAMQALEKAAYPEARHAFARAAELLDGVPDSPVIALRRLGIATGIGSVEISTRGFGAEESRRAFLRARELCDELGREVPLEVLGAIFGAALVTSDNEETERILPYFEELADRTEDPLRSFSGHQVLSVHRLWRGRFEEAARHARIAVELYRRESVRNVAWEVGFGCHSLAYRMSAEFHLGHPDEAEAARLEMLERVETHGNPAMIAVGLGWSTTLTIDTGRFTETLEIATRLSRICREQQLVLWGGYAALARGAALAGLGAGSEAVPAVQEGLAILDAVGVRCGRAYYLAYLARAFLADGKPQEAHDAADQGVALCRQVWTRFHEPELLRLRGLACTAMGQRNAARRDLRESATMAAADGSRAMALRALSDLVELRDRSARAGLAALVALLDGNGETEDLRRARSLVATAR
jgi:tetratricopeptide (TPR) repeat protein